MIAGSAVSIEGIIEKFRGLSDRPVTVCGTSLGGIVTCPHALSFGSADTYLPLYAGAQVGNVFMESA